MDYASTDVLTGFHEKSYGLMCSNPRVVSTSHVKEVDQNHIEICQSECMFRSHLPCDTEIFDLCMMYMVENSLQSPENLEEALELYIFLRISIHRDI